MAADGALHAKAKHYLLPNNVTAMTTIVMMKLMKISLAPAQPPVVMVRKYAEMALFAIAMLRNRNLKHATAQMRTVMTE